MEKKKKGNYRKGSIAALAVIFLLAGARPTAVLAAGDDVKVTAKDEMTVKDEMAAKDKGAVQVRLQLSQQVAGIENTREQFSYVLKEISSENPSPDQREFYRKGAGIAFLDVILYEAGTYRYTLEQLPGRAAGWTYDKTVYQAEVCVTRGEESNELSAVVLYYNEAGKRRSRYL